MTDESPTGYDAMRDDPSGIPGVYINPGAGPVAGATKEHALANANQFATDIQNDDDHDRFVGVSAAGDESEGRWPFRLTAGGRECVVEMPGLPLESVRYVDRESQNIWHFPRLYVDGGSWVWLYGLNIAREALFGEEE